MRFDPNNPKFNPEITHSHPELVRQAGAFPYDNTGSGLAADNFQDAVDEIAAAAGGGPHNISHQNGGADEISIAGLDGVSVELAAHLADTADAHDASAISFSPTGTIAATDTQAAVAEVASEAATALTTHDGDSTAVHGIANTANLYAAGGTDVAVADGGTGASTPAAARAALGTLSFLPWRTGSTFYYTGPFATSSNLVLVQNTLYAFPFYVPATVTVDRIAVTTTGTASAQARLGIYLDNAGVPDALVVDGGAIATATSGLKTVTVSQVLTGGTWYWLAAAMQGAAGTLTAMGPNTNLSAQMGNAAPFSNAGLTGYSQTGISGALPSPWGATKTEQGRVPIVWVRIT